MGYMLAPTLKDNIPAMALYGKDLGSGDRHE